MLGETLYEFQRLDEAHAMFEQALVIARARDRDDWIEELSEWLLRSRPLLIDE